MPSSHAFAEKVALVTEGNSPIGRAVAMQLALNGAYVIIAHSVEESANVDIQELKSLGTLAASVAYNETGQGGARQIVKKVDELYGRLDLLVNCSPVIDPIEFGGTTTTHLSRVMEKVLESVFFNTKESMRLMRDRPKPKLVNIFNSCDGPTSSDPAQRTANAALTEFTIAIAADSPGNFQVNGIRVSEKQSDSAGADELDPELFRPKPAVDPDDVARSVLFLLSSESKGLNGQIFDIGQ